MLEFGNHEQTLVTIIGTGIFQITINLLNQRKEAKRAERERQIRADEVKAKLDEDRLMIAREVALKIANLEAQSRDHAEDIKHKIQENTQISVKAFDVANHVNDKIAGIQEATLTMLQDHLKQERIVRTTDDIQKRVVKIEHEVVPGDKQ